MNLTILHLIDNKKINLIRIVTNQKIDHNQWSYMWREGLESHVAVSTPFIPSSLTHLNLKVAHPNIHIFQISFIFHPILS